MELCHRGKENSCCSVESDKGIYNVRAERPTWKQPKWGKMWEYNPRHSSLPLRRKVRPPGIPSCEPERWDQESSS